MKTWRFVEEVWRKKFKIQPSQKYDKRKEISQRNLHHWHPREEKESKIRGRLLFYIKPVSLKENLPEKSKQNFLIK